MANSNFEKVKIDKALMFLMLGLQSEYEMKYGQLSRWLERRHGIKITPQGLRLKLTTFRKEYMF
ncbi:hypothetical protein [Desulfuromonas acetoxidans]|uniref:hypothetical protein n=1 Tax=Desulfuromonas acetoxidans TaxID=891 RepID=UPI00292F2968